MKNYLYIRFSNKINKALLYVEPFFFYPNKSSWVQINAITWFNLIEKPKVQHLKSRYNIYRIRFFFLNKITNLIILYILHHLSMKFYHFFLSLSFYFSMRIPKGKKRRRNKCQVILCKSCRLKIGSNVNGKHVMMSCGFYAFTLKLG